MFMLPAAAVRRDAPVGDPLRATVSRDSDTVVLDFGEPRTVRTLGFPVRWHYGELATRLIVEASMDRASWSTAWHDWTGAPTLAAALLDPQVVPLRLTLPDVPARYLRVRPAPRWMEREIVAYSPR
jgi:hypothetical protein